MYQQSVSPITMKIIFVRSNLHLNLFGKVKASSSMITDYYKKRKTDQAMGAFTRYQTLLSFADYNLLVFSIPIHTI